jgi:hypothetical protein
MFSHDNPYGETWGESYKNIQLNYEKMRRTCLQDRYEKVWIVESDTIVPPDALRKLLEVDAPVVSGLYAMRHGEPYPNLMRMGLMPGIGASINWEEFTDRWGETIEVSGACMGCLLLDRSVLWGFSFNTKENRAPDVPLMEYCWQNKLKQMARTDVICGHVKPSGETLWPVKGGYVTTKNGARPNGRRRTDTR